jgi:hypothetical protein
MEATMNRFPGRKALLILAAVLAMIIHIYAAARAEQTRPSRRPDPQTQLLNNYRKYPDRYIRISGESWKYDEDTKTASHSFALKNIAGVAYSGIEIRASYMDPNGKTMQKQVLKIPGILSPYQTKKFKGIKTRNVPAASDQALLAVITASIYP